MTTFMPYPPPSQSPSGPPNRCGPTWADFDRLGRRPRHHRGDMRCTVAGRAICGGDLRRASAPRALSLEKAGTAAADPVGDGRTRSSKQPALRPRIHSNQLQDAVQHSFRHRYPSAPGSTVARFWSNSELGRLRSKFGRTRPKLDQSRPTTGRCWALYRPKFGG